MNFEPEYTVKSALPGFEDVSFKLLQFTEGVRIKLRMELADVNAAIRDLLVARAEADELPKDQRAARYARIAAEMQDLIDDKINPARVRCLLVSVDGLSIRGVPATVDTMISSGPPALYKEIQAHINGEAGLTEKERGESALPATSNVPVDGQTSNTSAGTVGNADSI